MSDFGALTYLEARQAVNFVRRAMRQPGRVIMYAIAIAYFVGMIWLRVAVPHAFGHFYGIREPYASAIGFGACMLTGLWLAIASNGRIAAFSSDADARFLIDSKLRERNVIVWLQMRATWRSIAKAILIGVFYAILFPYAGTPAGIALSVIGLTAFESSFVIPIMRLRRAGLGVIATIAAWALLASGFAGLTVLLLPRVTTIVPLSWTHAAEAMRLGIAAQAFLSGNATALGILYALTILLIAVSYFGATDLYPELLAASRAAIDMRARGLRSPFGGFISRRDPAVPSIQSSVFRSHASAVHSPRFGKNGRHIAAVRGRCESASSCSARASSPEAFLA